eukprot:750623-Rhodomonas_salina.3
MMVIVALSAWFGGGIIHRRLGCTSNPCRSSTHTVNLRWVGFVGGKHCPLPVHVSQEEQDPDTGIT